MFNRFALALLILTICPPVIAGTSICSSYGCVLLGTLPANLHSEIDGGVRAKFSQGRLMVGSAIVAEFALPDVRIVIGDWDGDGTDEPGAYADGYWLLQGGWDVNSPQQLIDMTALGHDASAVPLIGSWQGSQADGLGLYDGGVFTLYSDYNDLSQSVVIDFGNVPNDTGTAWESMPFVGPIDEFMDRVGLLKGESAAYAQGNVAGNYQFPGPFKGLMSGTLPLRDPGPLAVARPYVLDADVLENVYHSGFILALRALPGAEPEPEDCGGSQGYTCFDDELGRPLDGGAIIVPNETAF